MFYEIAKGINICFLHTQLVKSENQICFFSFICCFLGTDNATFSFVLAISYVVGFLSCKCS